MAVLAVYGPLLFGLLAVSYAALLVVSEAPPGRVKAEASLSAVVIPFS